MFENIVQFFKKFKKSEKEESKSTAKERLHLVLAQDRANISADFLEMMKQEILEVIKKYIDIDEKTIDVRLTNKEGEDGSVGAPALYANIPIITIKNDARKLEGTLKKEENKENKEDNKEEKNEKAELEENNNNSKVEEKSAVEKALTELNEKKKAEHIDENVDNSTNNNKVSNNPKNVEQDNNSDTVNTENDNLNEDDNEKKNS